MTGVLDYSGGVPSGATVKADGYSGVLRYLKKNGNSSVHVLTAGEYQDMKANGIGVGLVYEAIGANRMLGGYASGASDASWALQQAHNVGINPRCIYYTADWDVVPSQYAAVIAYLDGANSIHGKSRTGLYGGYRTIANCKSHASWLWQTMAWSGGQIDPSIHVRQKIGTVVIGGVDCDESEIWQDDWGQHPAPATDPVDPPAKKGLPEMLIARPTTPGTYLLVSGAGVTVLLDDESVSALVHAGVVEATLSDADFNRLKALVK